MASPASRAADQAVHVQLVIDRSGSMRRIADDTVDAINGFLAKQAAEPGKLRVSIADFDSADPFRVVVDAIPIAEVGVYDDFEPRGGTPLLDAIGRAVERCDARVEESGDDEDQVLVVMTDGAENAPTDHTADSIRTLLDARQAAGWAIVFLGANQDSFRTGGRMGVARGTTRNFDASGAGVRSAIDDVSTAVLNHRRNDRQTRRETNTTILDPQDDRS